MAINEDTTTCDAAACACCGEARDGYQARHQWDPWAGEPWKFFRVSGQWNCVFCWEVCRPDRRGHADDACEACRGDKLGHVDIGSDGISDIPSCVLG